MHKNIAFIFALLFLYFSLNELYGQSNTGTNQFLSVVVEIASDPQSQEVSARLTSFRKISARLKSPTLSEEKPGPKSVIVQFLSGEGKVHENIILKDPFLTDYEYVNEDQRLEHVILPEAKKAYHLRVPFHESIKYIQLLQREKTGYRVLFKDRLF